MKKIIIIIVALILSIPTAFAQNIPQGMKYQAIARDLDGNVLSNQKVVLKINLQGDAKNAKTYYTETHTTVTNQFGLFSLVIGSGIAGDSKFSAIPWSSEDVWLSVEIMDNKSQEFTIVSNSKLLAVPYAFHAATASDIVNKDALARGKKPGVPSQNWSLFGNRNSNPLEDKLGTTDSTDLVMVTNNKERLRITADGQIITGDGKFTIGGNLEVQGDSTVINKDLYVGRNVNLNINEEFDPKGETINYGNFTVENMSSTLLTGTLDVDKEAYLGAQLDVAGDGFFEKNVVVADTLFADVVEAKSLNLSADVADGNYIATLENTNDGNGDGLKIKLGRKATKNNAAADAIDGPLQAFVGEGFGPENFDQIKNLLDGNLNSSDLAYLALLQVPTVDDLTAIAATACQLTEVIGNSLIDFLNDSLSLPATIGPYGIDTDLLTVTVVPQITIIPEIPTLNLPCEALGDGFTLPTLQFSEFISNPLSKENKFIEFTDNTDWTMGAIQAESVEDWAIQYLDPVFLYELYSTFKGLDKAKILPEILVTGKEVAKAYLDIGVQYSSGNGDYAEWLERDNVKEIITAGDIVAVKGGKITKDLTNAEQVMAVSHRPIVLGNIPKAGKNHLGNNVAFMGQIPVKVMGPVKTGDYIVAKSDIPGYGIAVSPEKMTVEDFKLTVGRSWVANSATGPKMVNTVVGVHNGDYLDILKRYEMKFQDSESRLESLESKVDILVEEVKKGRISN